MDKEQLEQYEKDWKKIAYLDCDHTKIGETEFDSYGDWECHIYQSPKTITKSMGAASFDTNSRFNSYDQDWCFFSEGGKLITGVSNFEDALKIFKI